MEFGNHDLEYFLHLPQRYHLRFVRTVLTYPIIRTEYNLNLDKCLIVSKIIDIRENNFISVNASQIFCSHVSLSADPRSGPLFYFVDNFVRARDFVIEVPAEEENFLDAFHGNTFLDTTVNILVDISDRFIQKNLGGDAMIERMSGIESKHQKEIYMAITRGQHQGVEDSIMEEIKNKILKWNTFCGSSTLRVFDRRQAASNLYGNFQPRSLAGLDPIYGERYA